MRLFSLFDNPLGRLRGRARRNIRYALFGSWSAKTKGDRGERRVAGILSRVRFCSDNHLLNNLMLPWPDGGTCQIDHVIVADSGIYVVEVKNYSGWIFGNERNKYWTQVLNYGKEKYRFYNPIMQNEGHIKSLKELSNQFAMLPIFNVVLFAGNCTLKNITYNSENVYVGYASNITYILNRIKEYSLASYNNKNEIIYLLKKAVNNGNNPYIVNKHIANVQRWANMTYN